MGPILLREFQVKVNSVQCSGKLSAVADVAAAAGGGGLAAAVRSEEGKKSQKRYLWKGGG